MTTEQKARFFGQHIGGKCVAFGELNEVAVDNLEYCFCDENCKLILRPLSSINENESIELLKIGGWQDPEWCAKHYLSDKSRDMTFVERVFSAEQTPYEYISIADYLRSKSFCLPFMGIDPLEAGWATLETNETK
jgi:hypothetical protein